MEGRAEGKIYRSEEEWRAHVEGYTGSGLSCAEYCEKEGLCKSALYRWQRKFKGGGKQRVSAKKFIEVMPAAPARPDSLIELELPQGIILRVRG